jgi:hypothetical protein
LLLCLLLVLWEAVAAAATPNHPEIVAVVIGVNQDWSGRPALRYADDDAIQYASLFTSLGADVYLLTTPDANTVRVHAAATSHALPPTRARLDRVIADVGRRVARARRAGRATTFYFIYAGHGDVRDGRGVLGLIGGDLTGSDLVGHVLARVNADEAHVIVDACYASLLVNPRGPGGRRRTISGFTRLSLPALPDNVGLLLSTTSGRQSHEWEGFQAGVFSHEVRSGLYGAADVDGDGRVTYREIGAFVSRANAAIPNERFRPDVFARPPRGTARLVDLRAALGRRIEIASAVQGHYILEDALGVRILEFHGRSEPTSVVRPASSSQLYFVRSDGKEYVLPNADVVQIAALEPQEPRVSSRGAAHEAFERVFSLPFDRRVESRYSFDASTATLEPAIYGEASAPRSRGRRTAMWLAYGLSAASVAAGGYATYRAREVRNSARAGEPQEEISSRNDRISRLNTTAGVLYGLAGGALVTGTILMLWPDSPPTRLEVTGDSALVGFATEF